jgi:Spy/CpxP family protein refolding chaperone
MKHSLSLLAATVLLVACATAQQGGGSPKADHPGSVPVLLGLDPVRQDLNLTPAQCGLLDALLADYKSQAKNLVQLGNADMDSSLRSSWDLRSLRKQFNGRALALLSPDQLTRFRQIERQMLGGQLLTSPAEQKLLGLSPSQQAQLSALEKDDQSRASAIMIKAQNGQLSPYWKGVKLRENSRQTSGRMLSVLTPEQKKNWLVLSGQKNGLPKVHDPNARTESLFEGY